MTFKKHGKVIIIIGKNDLKLNENDNKHGKCYEKLKLYYVTIQKL